MKIDDLHSRLNVQFNIGEQVIFDPLEESVYPWEMPKFGTTWTIKAITLHHMYFRYLGVDIELYQLYVPKDLNKKMYLAFKDDLIQLNQTC